MWNKPAGWHNTLQRIAMRLLALLLLFISSAWVSAQQTRAQTNNARIGCAGEAALPAGKAKIRIAYPFDVERIKTALKRIDKPKNYNVKVLVVDNSFAGYSLEGGTGHPTSIFPDAFFYRDPMNNSSRPSQFIRAPGPDDDAATWGHGTHVTGLILGGMYGAGPPIIGDLGHPKVRQLLLEKFAAEPSTAGQQSQQLIRIFVAALKKGTREWDSSELERLTRNSDIPKPYRRAADIVNISLLTPATKDGNEERYRKIPGDFPTALVVVSAGNQNQPIGQNGDEFPAMSDWSDGNLIVVGAHDSDLTRSEFSNYDSRRVTLAAPGCAISSWFSGDSKARPANGTSQAAAIVSFAAVLLKAYWGAEPNDLSERLIASSRYSAALSLGCYGNKLECVRWGSVLDVEMALYFDQDVIEYCVDETGNATSADMRPAAIGCKTRLALGKIISLPPEVTQCVTGTYGSVATGVKLTRPSGVRIMRSGKYQTIYRHQAVGNEDSLTACNNIDAPNDNFVFQPLPRSAQPDGLPIQNGSPLPDGQQWHVSPARVVRVVTRSTADETQ
jgi:hypothetical protein